MTTTTATDAAAVLANIDALAPSIAARAAAIEVDARPRHAYLPAISELVAGVHRIVSDVGRAAGDIECSVIPIT